MTEYQFRPFISMWAAKPESSSLDFYREAYKRGLDLIAASPVDPDTGKNKETHLFFCKQGTSEIICSPGQVLVLPDVGLQQIIGKPYFVISELHFETLFQEVGAEKPKDPEVEVLPPVEPNISKILEGHSFYLDAGHGGSDPGAVNAELGLYEKVAALECCLLLATILRNAGALVYLSRSDDSYPSLTQRASEANKFDVDAFISIHLNSATNKTASGIETFVYSNTGTAYALANIVQKNMVAATGFKNRGVKERTNLTVLKKTRMPAILCEIGFISNNDEAAKLFDKKYQMAITNAIYQGLVSFFGKK